MQKKSFFSFATALTLFPTLFCAEKAWSLDQIIRPYQSIRSSGMGGVTLSTGLYDENYFGNPARVTANPRSRVSILELMAETDSSAISHVSDFTGSGDFYTKMSSTSGSNNHVRLQSSFPSVYVSPKDSKIAFAFGILMSTQADVTLRNSLQIDPTFITDLGPALTVGSKLLDDNSLSIGATAHATYRLATNQTFTFVDLIKGKTLAVTNIAGQGAHLDFDLGATYLLPFEIVGAKLTAAATINNFLGGKYSNLGLHPVANLDTKPPAQPRTLGFGMSAKFDTLWAFTDTLVALEFRDIGNNPNGGLFRTVHVGTEARYGVLIPRLGINQGYLAAGLGLDLTYFTLDVATYGEEMSLNPGGLQDRRVAVKIAFQI